jgi:hypothetical protein
VHAAKNRQHGSGRFLHRKTLLGAIAEFEVYPDLPEAARYGLFAAPGKHKAVVRLSHGSFDMQANTKPDIRGFAVKVWGVSGPGALGHPVDHQDFLLINHDRFASRTSDEFLEVTVTAAEKGEVGLLVHLIRKNGLGKGLHRLGLLLSTLRKPFSGYNSESFSTAVPLAVGPYAAKLRIRPVAPAAMNTKDSGEDIVSQLARGPIAYEVSLQFFTDATSTPIEDPPAAWSEADSPFAAVAKLTLLAAGAEVEKLAFDPWGGLEAHRPLGEIMRARKGVYYASQKARGIR